VTARFRSVLAALVAASSLLLPGQAEGQFGRNRVRYEPQEFQRLSTEHLDLYHAPGLEGVASDAARLAERAYSRLSRLLQHDFRDRIPILLYGSPHQFRQTNALTGPVDEATGGATEFFKRRVVLPFTGSWQEFEHVLAHELVHAFQLDIIHGGAPPEALLYGSHPPLWFLEGMAEYLSVGLLDSQTEAWLHDGVLTGYLPDLATLARDGGYLSYRYGQAFWGFVAERWGDEAVGEILQRVNRLGTDGAFLAVTGLDTGGLGEEWGREARRRALEAMVDRAAEGTIRGVRPLTPRVELSDPWTVAPALSPDGETLAYLSTRGGESFDLWLADPRTGEPLRRLVRGGRSPGLESLRFMSSSPSFSPDGGTLAFTAKAGAKDALILLDLEGGGHTRVDLPLRTAETPSWSPDGAHLVLSGTDGGTSDLWILRRDGTGVRPLTRDGYAALHPAWSPDGRWIAFVTDRGPGEDREQLRFGAYRIALLDPESGELRMVPGQSGRRNINPAWSPDGRILAWVGDVRGLPELMLHVMGSEVVQRVEGVRAPILGITPLSPVLSWSSSGTMILVTLERAGYGLHSIDDPTALPRAPLPPEKGTALVSGATPQGGEEGVGRAGGRDARLRRALQEGRSVRTLRSILDSASALLPDTVGFERGQPSRRLSPDLVAQPTLGAQVGGGYGSGLYGGAAVAASDILGNHRVAAGFSLNGSLRDAAAGVQWVWSRNRWDLLVGVDQVPFYSWIASTVIPGEARNGWEDIYLREVARRTTVGVRYPFSPFRRVELQVVAGNDGRDLLELGFEPTGEVIRRTTGLGAVGYVHGSMAWVHDDTRWDWRRPVGGSRARVELLQSTGGLDYGQVQVDLRSYLGRGAGRQGPVVATRLFTRMRHGRESDLRSAHWGGALGVRGWNGGSFREGSGGGECTESREAVEGGALSPCPVRDQLVGSSGGLASLEVRVPVTGEIRLGDLGRLPPVEMMGFLDAGMAWSRRVCGEGRIGLGGAYCSHGPRPQRTLRRTAMEDPFLLRAPVMSWGVGVRLNLLLAQLEIHHARPLERPGRGGVWGVVLSPPF